MKIYKNPEFENDSYMFVIDLKKDEFELSRPSGNYTYEYIEAKIKAFENKSKSKKAFEAFNDRPSFANFDNVEDLSGTIYTYTCQNKNKLDYAHIIRYCKHFKDRHRRCVVNFADTLHDYLSPHKDTSCLNSIHYYKDNVTVYFRASDIKNELLLDLYLINRFFIEPVGKFKTLTVMSSTAQNVGTKLSTLIR